MDATELQLRRRISALEIKMEKLIEAVLELSYGVVHPHSEAAQHKLHLIDVEDEDS